MYKNHIYNIHVDFLMILIEKQSKNTIEIESVLHVNHKLSIRDWRGVLGFGGWCVMLRRERLCFGIVDYYLGFDKLVMTLAD